jgi:short-subunit dehydrogenase
VTRALALVTGASSGIGLELARLFARDGYDLLLVARGRERLEEAARELARAGVDVTVHPADLADPGAIALLAETVAARGLSPEVLVNNAGLGVYGPFAETALERELGVIRVNVEAATALAKLFLPGMLARRRGGILNVASTAAFQPGPLMAVYYATKAYLLSFSEAIADELRGTGVTVTALCPGPTRTNFQKQAGMERSRLIRTPLVMDVREVARIGYEGFRRGRRVVIPGVSNRLVVGLERFFPRTLVTSMTRKVQESRRT